MKRALPALRVLAFALFVASAWQATSAQSATTRFDGAWNVTLTCPPHDGAGDDAKGYTHRFAGQVVGGEFSATHKREGEPGWHFLHGKIKDDGDAALRLDGIVNNPDYAINDAPRGKSYTYRVKAHFDANSGRGERLSGRVCTFAFDR